jgi:hypothetical protein
MRTTLNLDEELLNQAKLAAARGRTTLTAFVEAALRERLLRADADPPEQRAPLPLSTRRGGFRPGVDLDDNVATRDLMDEGLALEARR